MQKAVTDQNISTKAEAESQKEELVSFAIHRTAIAVSGVQVAATSLRPQAVCCSSEALSSSRCTHHALCSQHVANERLSKLRDQMASFSEAANASAASTAATVKRLRQEKEAAVAALQEARAHADTERKNVSDVSCRLSLQIT